MWLECDLEECDWNVTYSHASGYGISPLLLLHRPLLDRIPPRPYYVDTTSAMSGIFLFLLPLPLSGAQGGVKCPKFHLGIPWQSSFLYSNSPKNKNKLTLLIDLYMSNITSKILVKGVFQKPAKTQGHNRTSYFSAQMLTVGPARETQVQDRYASGELSNTSALSCGSAKCSALKNHPSGIRGESPETE